MTNPASAAPIDRALSMVRALGALVLAATASSAFSGALSPKTQIALVLLAALLLATTFFGWVAARTAPRSVTWKFQLLADASVSIAAGVLLSSTHPGVALTLVGLPVVEAALRMGLVASVSMWALTTALIAVPSILTWTPGDGYSPITEVLAVTMPGLVLALPAGFLADGLSKQVDAAQRERSEIQRHRRINAVLTVTAKDLTSTDRMALAETAVVATTHLGFDGSDMGVLDPLTLEWTVVAAEGSAAQAPGELEVGASSEHIGSTASDEEHQIRLGVIAKVGGKVLLLRAHADGSTDRADLRDEAFDVVVSNLVTAMSIANRSREISPVAPERSVTS